MGKEKLQCDYCGKVKAHISFCIGASLAGNGKYDWTMWEGTGKVSCDSQACYVAASNESHEATHSLSKGR